MAEAASGVWSVYAGSEEVPCPANTTLMLPESLGYQASDEHRGSVDCPDAAAVCAADVDTLGQVTCGTQADCRERGVCTGGRCRCAHRCRVDAVAGPLRHSRQSDHDR